RPRERGDPYPPASVIGKAGRHSALTDRPRRMGPGSRSLQTALRAARSSLGRDDSLMHDLEQAGRAHASADAHRDDGIFRLSAAALDQRVTREPRARHAVRMAHGNGAAIDVDLLRIDAELVAAIKHLHRERLVQLPEIDIIDLESVTLQKPRHREH